MTRMTKAERIAASAPINHRGWLTRRMAADYLSVGVDFILQYTSSGDLKPVNTGSGNNKFLKYRRSDLDELMEAIAEKRTKLNQIKSQTA